MKNDDNDLHTVSSRDAADLQFQLAGYPAIFYYLVLVPNPAEKVTWCWTFYLMT